MLRGPTLLAAMLAAMLAALPGGAVGGAAGGDTRWPGAGGAAAAKVDVTATSGMREERPLQESAAARSSLCSRLMRDSRHNMRTEAQALRRQPSGGPDDLDRRGPDPVADRDRGLTGVQHDARDEPVTELLAQHRQPTGVRAGHGRTGLDLDPGHPPVRRLEHDVDARPVAVPVVEHRRRLLGPAELLAQLPRDEALEQLPRVLGVALRAGASRGHVDQAGREPGIELSL